MLYVADVYESRTEMTDAPIVVLVYDHTPYTIHVSNHRAGTVVQYVWWYLTKVLVHV